MAYSEFNERPPVQASDNCDMLVAVCMKRNWCLDFLLSQNMLIEAGGCGRAKEDKHVLQPFMTSAC